MSGLEAEAIQASNRIIIAIEDLVATWDAAVQKPLVYAPIIVQMKYVHQALSDWERRMLKTRGTVDVVGRERLLRQFCRIFEPYKNRRGWNNGGN